MCKLTIQSRLGIWEWGLKEAVLEQKVYSIQVTQSQIMNLKNKNFISFKIIQTSNTILKLPMLNLCYQSTTGCVETIHFCSLFVDFV